MQDEDLQIEIESLNHNSEEFTRFLMAWGEEIESIFPDFSEEEATFASICLIKVQSQPSGLFVYQAKGEEAHVEVDYIIPKYRDQGIGRKFFAETLEIFKQKGFDVIVISTENQVHIDYISEAGFKRSKMHHSRFELRLN